MTKHAILAIDQGTTSTRAMVFGLDGQVHARAQEEFTQHYPGDAHVEHDPEDIWNTTVDTVREALAEASAKGAQVAGIGITNQRETVLVWDRRTGEPIHRAIVWQDRRTADVCARLLREGAEEEVRTRTGLVIDPYFSATKIAWLLDDVDGARARAEAGELACGTVDSFLIWRLTGGRVHATDVTNASRTSLFNIRDGEWDDELLRLFNVPRAILPEVRDCAADFGETDEALFGRAIPIRGVAGDQQAAAIGQACFEPGALKSTYGTGCFALMNTGPAILESKSRLLSTVAYGLSGKMTYAVEGSIFIAGAAVQWLRDGLGLLSSSEETEERAARAAADARVVMVPAFTGMGAPHWLPEARAAVFGMTRATGKDELARAALEGVVYQTYDLFAAMAKDGLTPQRLRVDGGMAANDWFVQRLADVLALEVDRPEVLETTALGAAYLAALGLGEFASLDEVAANWRLERSFAPSMPEGDRQQRLARWTACCEAVIAVAKAEAGLRT